MKVNKVLIFIPIVGLIYGILDARDRGMHTEITNATNAEMQTSAVIQGLSIAVPLIIFIFNLIT